jgi:hypothetical protein
MAPRQRGERRSEKDAPTVKKDKYVNEGKVAICEKKIFA